MRPPDQDIGGTNVGIHRLSSPLHAMLSEGPACRSPHGSACSAQETTRNNLSFTYHCKVNTRMGDLSSQDSIRGDMVARRQTLQEQRDNM